MAFFADSFNLLTNQSGSSIGAPIGGLNQASFSFVLSRTGNIDNVKIVMQDTIGTGGPISFDVALFNADSVGKPTGAALETISPSITFSSSITDKVITVTFSGLNGGIAGAKFAIVVSAPALAILDLELKYAFPNEAQTPGLESFSSTDGGSVFTTIGATPAAHVIELTTISPNPGLDQVFFGRVKQTTKRWNGTSKFEGQLFTPSVTGTLDKITTAIMRDAAQTGGGVTYEVQTTTGGLPDGAVLASETIPDASIVSFGALPANTKLDIIFSSPPLLTGGVTYAIVQTQSVAAGGYLLYKSGNLDGNAVGDRLVSNDSGASWSVPGPGLSYLYGSFMSVLVTTTKTITSDSEVLAIGTTVQNITSNSTITATVTQTITSDAFHGQETTKTIASDTTISITSEQTITSDAFHGQETTQTITSEEIIVAEIEQTITANAQIKEPLIFFAEAQVIKLFEDDKEIETEVDNPIPAAPTGLIAADPGKGDALILSWTSTAKFFNVFRKDPGPTFVKVNDNVLESVTIYLTGGLTAGTSVTFIVRAVNGIGQESPNSNEVTATPTFAIDRFQQPTYEVKVNGTPVVDAILGIIGLGFGSNISQASFTLPKDPRLIGNPSLEDEVEIILNGRLVFKGFITTRANLIDENSGLRISYTCSSTLINLTKKALRDTTVSAFSVRFNIFLINPDGEAVILNRRNAVEILDSFGVSGAPKLFPGQVDVTDLTRLTASELVLSRIGNFKLFHDMTSGITSVYNFGSGGLVTREFGFGKNIINFDIRESNIDTVNAIELIGAPIQIRQKKRVFFNPGTTKSGSKVAQATLTGQNIRDIEVFGFFREPPKYTFDAALQVSLLDFGVTSGRGSFLLSSRSKKIRSNITFASLGGTSSTTRSVTFDPVTRTAQINTGSGTFKQNVRQGDTYINPETGQDFIVNFTRNGEFQLVRSVSGQTAQIIGTSPISTVASRFISSFASNASKEETSNLFENDIMLRPVIIREKIYSTERRSIGAKIEYFGRNKVIINLATVPKKWVGVTKAGRVDRTLIGAGTGIFTARILLWNDWKPGAVEVEFTVDADPPVVKVGSGAVCRTITDQQYAILVNRTTGFNNTNRVLQEMQIRANGELARANQVTKSGSITVVGDEELDLRQSILVDGEKLEVSGVTHDFTNGYTTTVNLTNERFFQTLVPLPPIKEINQRNKRQEEKGRRGITIGFETRELVEARKDKQRAQEASDKDVPASSPFGLWGE